MTSHPHMITNQLKLRKLVAMQAAHVPRQPKLRSHNRSKYPILLTLIDIDCNKLQHSPNLNSRVHQRNMITTFRKSLMLKSTMTLQLRNLDKRHLVVLQDEVSRN